ncbi:MAG: nucleotidyltransferase [Clostridia bacterium]|nr:nucleotidyltransferase [Clostridia bacterium]
MNASLVIMAAGIGSRFGGGIKQLEKVGPNGEIIMDYSIHDAVKAGFDHVVFVIRKDIEKEFHEIIGGRIQEMLKPANVKCDYVFQSLDDLPEGFTLPEGRTKPWGTCQAVLSAAEKLHNPFAVINADDYYGQNAYRSMAEYLKGLDPENPEKLCMSGFVLKNTLSENGSVTRGVCSMNDQGLLSGIKETKNIVIGNDGPEADGVRLDPESLVSMNMWGLTPAFLRGMASAFRDFLSNLSDPKKDEFLLPVYIGDLLKAGKAEIRVLPTTDKWFGVTYKEDAASVRDSLKALHDGGLYASPLFSDL